jgi:hypothetical protein
VLLATLPGNLLRRGRVGLELSGPVRESWVEVSLGRVGTCTALLNLPSRFGRVEPNGLGEGACVAYWGVRALSARCPRDSPREPAAQGESWRVGELESWVGAVAVETKPRMGSRSGDFGLPLRR